MKHKCSLLNGRMFYSKYCPQLSISQAAGGTKTVFDMEDMYYLVCSLENSFYVVVKMELF